MQKQSIAFLGAKNIGAYCLQFLVDNASELEIEIAAVVTRSAQGLDSEVTVYDIAKSKNIEIYERADKLPPVDLIISVQHNEILSQEQIDKANLAVNLHMAPLPEYRGCNQFSFAIIDDAEEFGTTIHLMTAGIDNGDILFERRFAIDHNIWVDELYNKTVDESKTLFERNIKQVIKREFTPISQATLVKERGTSFHLRKEIQEIKVIDESWSLEKKKRYVRATFKSGFEPPYSLIDGNKKYYTKESF